MILPRSFTALAWSNLAAQSAEQICIAAIPMVAVLSLGAGAAETGFITAAQTLPFLLLSIPAGIVADRFSRRRLMVAAEALRALSLLALVALSLMDALSIPLLVVLGFLGATGTVTFSVAGPALVPSLVPRDALSIANGRLELARSAAFTVGPAAAGAIVGWLSGSTAFVLATGLSVLATWLLVAVRETAREAAPRRHVLRELHEGAAFILSHRWLRPILATTIVWNLSWFVMIATYVPFAVDVLHMDATGIGVTLALQGIGMVLGSLAAPRIMRRIPFGMAIVVGPLASTLASLAMALTLWHPSPFFAGLSFFLFGSGPVLWTISQITLRQTVTPNEMLGRVSALFMTASAGSRPLGAAIGGWIGATWSVEACLVASFAGFVVQSLVVMLSPLPALERLPKPVLE